MPERIVLGRVDKAARRLQSAQAELNEMIAAAVRAGVPATRVAERAGMSAARVRQIARDADQTPRMVTPIRVSTEGVDLESRPPNPRVQPGAALDKKLGHPTDLSHLRRL